MDKRGIGDLANFPLGLIGLGILILVLVVLIPIQEGVVDLENITSRLYWDQLNSTQIFRQGSDNIIIDVLYRFMDFIGYTAFEVTRVAVEWGSKNIDVSAEILIMVVVISLLAPIVFIVFKLIIVIVILIKEVIQSKMEKKKWGGYNQNENK